MTETDIEVFLALAAAIIALISALYTARVSKRTVELQHQMEREQHRMSKEELLEEVMSRYREPLVRAAFDLQSRVYNILKLGFFDTYVVRGSADEAHYALHSTLFVFAEYLGWVEILRRGVQFLNLGEVERNQRVERRLSAIRTALLSDEWDAHFRILHGQQRAIGEIMVVTGGDGAAPMRQCLGYAAFVERMENDASFSRWFEQLSADVQAMAATGDAGRQRLVTLQRALIDLIELLDDPPVRFPDPAVRRRL